MTTCLLGPISYVRHGDWRAQQHIISKCWKCDHDHLAAWICFLCCKLIATSCDLYASETWKSTNRIQHRLDVFHQRILRMILGITWKDKITNEEVLQRTGQRNLQDIVAERFRFAGVDTSSVYLRNAQNTAPWIGHQRRAGEREEDQTRHGGPHSKSQRGLTTTWNQPVWSRSSSSCQQNVQDGDILLPIVLQRIGGTHLSKSVIDVSVP